MSMFHNHGCYIRTIVLSRCATALSGQYLLRTPLLCFAISGFSVVPSGPISHPHVKGATPDAASNRGSRSPGDCSCGRLPESVPVSTFPELFDGPDRPGQQKPD